MPSEYKPPNISPSEYKPPPQKKCLRTSISPGLLLGILRYFYLDRIIRSVTSKTEKTLFIKMGKRFFIIICFIIFLTAMQLIQVDLPPSDIKAAETLSEKQTSGKYLS